MKYLGSLILALAFFSVNGQLVRFQLQRVNPCDNKTKVDSSNYYIKDNIIDSSYHLSGYNSDFVLLPGIGTYHLKTSDINPSTDAEIQIRDTGLFIYKIVESKIIFRTSFEIVDPFSYYTTCDILSKGYQDEYYTNGQIRIRGTFIEGQPKDSVVYYYPNGQIQKRATYFPKELLIEEFDSLSNIVRVNRKKRGYYLTDYTSTEYFKNKKIKLLGSRKTGIVTKKEFYDNGNYKIIQTKNNKIEYYSNGRQFKNSSWKILKDKTTNDSKFEIHETFFDSLGSLKEQQVYEIFFWGSNIKDHKIIRQSPELDISKSDWIISWKKQEQGSEIIVAEDISTEDYFKTLKIKNNH